MIEPLTGGGFIVDLTILSKEKKEILDVLKRSVLLNSLLYLAGGTGLALIKKNNLSIASVEDISTMKMISIIQRGLKKDFIDL